MSPLFTTPCTEDSRVIALWHSVRNSARTGGEREPELASFLHNTVLQHKTLCGALGFLLAEKLSCTTLSALSLRAVFTEAFQQEPAIVTAITEDLFAIVERDPGCDEALQALLFYKGFHALSAWRVANWLWRAGRQPLACFLQNRISVCFAVDIHPAASIGCGILFDHATGLVIGETAAIGNDVTMLQSVTLGGTGKETGDRHPKIGDGVLVGPGSKILGNIAVANCARIAAGSVILKPVPAGAVMAGVPARQIAQVDCSKPALDLLQHWEPQI